MLNLNKPSVQLRPTTRDVPVSSPVYALLGSTICHLHCRIQALKDKMGFKSAKGSAAKGSKAARRTQGGDSKDKGKRKVEETFMSPLEVMRQKYRKKKEASSSARQMDVSHAPRISLIPSDAFAPIWTDTCQIAVF
jgi:hypothetical protein